MKPKLNAMPLDTRSGKAFMIIPIIFYPHDWMYVIHIIWNPIYARNKVLEYFLIHVSMFHEYSKLIVL